MRCFACCSRLRHRCFELLRGNRNPRDRNLCVHQDDWRKFPVFCNVLLSGLMLGVLCDASTLLDATVVKLLILGMLWLLLSGNRWYHWRLCCIFLQERKVQSDGRHRRCVVCAIYSEGCTEGCCKGKSGSIYSGLCSRREYLRRYHNGNPDRYLYYVT